MLGASTEDLSIHMMSANVTVAVCQTSDTIQMPSGGSTRQIGASVDSWSSRVSSPAGLGFSGKGRDNSHHDASSLNSTSTCWLIKMNDGNHVGFRKKTTRRIGRVHKCAESRHRHRLAHPRPVGDAWAGLWRQVEALHSLVVIMIVCHFNYSGVSESFAIVSSTEACNSFYSSHIGTRSFFISY